MSEETEQSSEVKEEGLAQEALEATAEETPSAGESVTEPVVPLHKVTALRTRAQQAEVAQARAEGELAALKQVQSQQAPASKSPLDLEVERQTAAGIPEDEMTISPKVARAQSVYDRQVANQSAQAEATRKLGVQQLASTNKAKAVHDDWQEVIFAGQALLTQGELTDIGAAGDDFGELAYAKCTAALARNKSESKTETAPETKQSKSEAAEKVPSQQEILKGVKGDPAAVAAAQL